MNIQAAIFNWLTETRPWRTVWHPPSPPSPRFHPDRLFIGMSLVALRLLPEAVNLY